MSSISSCQATDIILDWYIPERALHRRLGEWYATHPVMSRVVASPVALISGVLKMALFPVISAVGVVVLPLIALIRFCQGKSDGCEWLKAWGFTLLGLGGCAGFALLVGFYLPLVATSACLVAALSCSIIIHVQQLIREPKAQAIILNY